MGRIAILAVVLVAAACSGGSDDAETSATTAIESPTSSAAGIGATTEALTDRVQLPTPSTSPPPTLSDAAGLDPEELLSAAPPAGYSFVELPADTNDALNARFLHEEVVEEVLRGVTARGVRYDDRVTGVVVAVAVAPTVAADREFQQAFQAEATAGADVESEPLEIGEEQLVRFVSGDIHSVLWQRENVFILVTSREPEDLVRSASALVATLAGPLEVVGDVDGDLLPDPVTPTTSGTGGG